VFIDSHLTEHKQSKITGEAAIDLKTVMLTLKLMCDKNFKSQKLWEAMGKQVVVFI
jgi:hypothetical protein